MAPSSAFKNDRLLAYLHVDEERAAQRLRPQSEAEAVSPHLDFSLGGFDIKYLDATGSRFLQNRNGFNVMKVQTGATKLCAQGGVGHRELPFEMRVVGTKRSV